MGGGLKGFQQASCLSQKKERNIHDYDSGIGMCDAEHDKGY